MDTGLFEQLAIAIKAGHEAKFFYGDCLDGYFEGATCCEAGGAGYVVRGRALFRDFISWRGDLENARARCTGAKLFPYGFRHEHGPITWDELTVLHQRRALALRVHCGKAGSLAVGPMLELRRDEEPQFETVGRTVLLTLPKRGLFIGFSSSQQFRLEARLERGEFALPVFRTTTPDTEFTLYLTFSVTRERALEQAERLRDSDAVEGHRRLVHDLLVRSHLWCEDEEYSRALMWAKLSSWFMVTDDPAKGIWAGLPWFRENWGRDTFIALPGTLLATGLFEEAREVIRQFARWQCRDEQSPDFGRIPNRVRGPGDVIFNTVDATPWFIREVFEFLQYTGDTQFAADLFPVVKLALDALSQKAADREGFLTHDDADTWMDARIEGGTPWSPRGNRACEIQALWHEALRCGARLAELLGDPASAARWTRTADAVRRHFTKRFWDAKRKLLADRLTADGEQDFRIRPNQLMLLSVPMNGGLLDGDVSARVLKNAVEELLFAHGVASLSQHDPWFHPHHRHENWHKDAAYHNGTVWGWNAGFATTALVRHGRTDMAWTLARNLADQILHLGHRGAMSELLDAWPAARNRLTYSGTWQQAWSTSEFVRNACQDFAGFKPRLLDGLVELAPNLPGAWGKFTGTFRFGRGGSVTLNVMREKAREVFLLKFETGFVPREFRFAVASLGRSHRFVFNPKPADTITIVCDAKGALVGVNAQWNPKPEKGEAAPPAPTPLSFAKPDPKIKPPCLAEKDWLRRQLEPAKGETASVGQPSREPAAKHARRGKAIDKKKAHALKSRSKKT